MQAFAGLISITGEPDRPGVRVGASVVDLGTGVGPRSGSWRRCWSAPRPVVAAT